MNDLLPESPQARAILAALEILKAAGIESMFDIDTGTPHPFRLMLKSDQATPAGREELRQGIQAVLEYQWQVAAMDLTVSQAKGAR